MKLIDRRNNKVTEVDGECLYDSQAYIVRRNICTTRSPYFCTNFNIVSCCIDIYYLYSAESGFYLLSAICVKSMVTIIIRIKS